MSAATGPRVEELTPAPDPWAVTRQFAHLPHLLFLDSADRHSDRGRYSFVSADPTVWITDLAGDPFADLARRLAVYPLPTIPGLPPFQGGIAGLFGYGPSTPSSACRAPVRRVRRPRPRRRDLRLGRRLRPPREGPGSSRQAIRTAGQLGTAPRGAGIGWVGQADPVLFNQDRIGACPYRIHSARPSRRHPRISTAQAIWPPSAGPSSTFTPATASGEPVAPFWLRSPNIPSNCTLACDSATRPRSRVTSTWATSPSPARRRSGSCGSRRVKSRRGRSRARGRADRPRPRTRPGPPS